MDIFLLFYILQGECMRHFIDLSIAIENGLPSDPPIMIPKITYMDHKIGGLTMQAFYPGLTENDLP